MKRKLVYRLRDQKVHSLLTLTSNPKYHNSPEAAFRSMSVAVNRLWKRLRRAYPDAELEYFLVWERTKAGWPHAHLLIRAPFIPQAALSSIWAELTGAPIVDIRQIHQASQAIAYIAKYLAKDPQAPDGMKKYRCSRRFFANVLPAEENPSSPSLVWSLVHKSPLELATDFSYAGYTAQEHADGSYTAHPPGRPVTGFIDRLTPTLASPTIPL